tara:strand:+ start:375 stop:1184 length:810 start_codon:yes stop_codon:yes gene_type:complete
MKSIRRVLTATTIALASLSANASSISAGGVTWDPDWVDGGEQDFSLSYDFTQWFSSTNVANNNVGSMQTSYTNAVGINTVLSTLNGSTASTGYFLSGVGEAYLINGDYSFCSGCELTLAFGGLELFKNNTFDVTNAWINLYVDNSADYSHPTSNVAEVASAMDGNIWISASILSFGLTGGTVDNGLASAQIQVTGGLAASYFLDSSLAGFALQSGSAFFNALSNAKYSSQGNGQVHSDTSVVTVPEPQNILMFSLGLLGLATVLRRKKV